MHRVCSRDGPSFRLNLTAFFSYFKSYVNTCLGKVCLGLRRNLKGHFTILKTSLDVDFTFIFCDTNAFLLHKAHRDVTGSHLDSNWRHERSQRREATKVIASRWPIGFIFQLIHWIHWGVLVKNTRIANTTMKQHSPRYFLLYSWIDANNMKSYWYRTKIWQILQK